MERSILIIVISGILVSGCNLFNSDVEKPTEEIAPFSWSYYTAPAAFKLMYIDENDVIFGGSDTFWAMSFDNGKSFKNFQQPDSVKFQLVRRYDNIFYAIGEYEITEMIFSSPTRVNSNGLFRSYDGNNWELILGPFWMYDFLLDDDGFLHVAKYGGVSSIDLSTQTEYLNDFLSTNSFDAISVLAKNSKGDVFAGCHDGMYKTTDNGKNWIRVSYPDVPKHRDDVTSLYIDDEDRIFAIAGRRLLLSVNDGDNWTIQDLTSNSADKPAIRDNFYPGAISFSELGFVFSSSYDGVYISQFDSIPSFYNAGPQGYNFDNTFDYNNAKAFKNGSLILQHNRALIYGSINPESDFWEERGWLDLIGNASGN